MTYNASHFVTRRAIAVDFFQFLARSYQQLFVEVLRFDVQMSWGQEGGQQGHTAYELHIVLDSLCQLVGVLTDAMHDVLLKRVASTDHLLVVEVAKDGSGLNALFDVIEELTTTFVEFVRAVENVIQLKGEHVIRTLSNDAVNARGGDTTFSFLLGGLVSP